MNEIDRKAIMTKAIDVYGPLLQETVAMEEMAELTKEITKNIRGTDNRKALVEEIADVSIMLDELKLIFKISDKELDDEIRFKLVRLNGKLREDED